jgi:hypothetical protein
VTIVPILRLETLSVSDIRMPRGFSFSRGASFHVRKGYVFIEALAV